MDPVSEVAFLADRRRDEAEAKRLKERENVGLKKMVAEQALDIRMLKDLNSKKW